MINLGMMETMMMIINLMMIMMMALMMMATMTMKTIVMINPMNMETMMMMKIESDTLGISRQWPFQRTIKEVFYLSTVLSFPL